MDSPSVLNLFSLEGQTALVTGGTRGLGQAMAVALAEAGADIILAQRDTSNTKTADEVKKAGRKCHIYPADLASPESVKALVPAVLADGHRIDVLLNCGGINVRHKAQDFPLDDWEAVLQVNLSSTFTLCRDVGVHMLGRPGSDVWPRGRRGAIINIASLLSFQGGYMTAAYSSSKGAVANLTRALSNEWVGQGISVNAIGPGYISTDMTQVLQDDPQRSKEILGRIPAGRWGAPDDLKGAVVFLASRASAYVSGDILMVDGGWMGR